MLPKASGSLDVVRARKWSTYVLLVAAMTTAAHAVETPAPTPPKATVNISSPIAIGNLISTEQLGSDNANAADTTNADQLRAGGGLGLSLTGAGVVVGVWDGGSIRSTHQELAGRVVTLEGVALNDHATHVAGTIGATGVVAGARGMASAVTIRSRDFNNDTVEMAADASQINLSNHSYSLLSGWESYYWPATQITAAGYYPTWFGDFGVSAVEDPTFGQYNSYAVEVDTVLHDNPHLLSVWAASNDRGNSFTSTGGGSYYFAYDSNGPSGSSWYIFPSSGYRPPTDGNGGTGYDTLPGGGQTAKNTLIVGSILDHTVDAHNGATVAISSFSSFGPTDDGRLGPHVVGNGDGLNSSLSTANNAYGTMSGTSMAAPNVTGTAALLLEHWRNNGVEPLAATQKALIIHTATDVTNAGGGTNATVGPDYSTGYGLVNGAAAANFITEAITEPTATRTDWAFEEDLNQGETWSFSLASLGSAIKATLVWSDPEGTAKTALDDTTSILVNDLDLWIEDALGNVYHPWTLNPNNPTAAAVRNQRNTLDNIEQVLIDFGVLPTAGVFTVFVSHTDPLLAGLPQDFSLLVSGGVLIPEPTAFAMMGGAAMFVFRRRKAA